MKTTDFGISTLSSRYNSILHRLERGARADRCAGDISSGWDWPTLRHVQPETYAELKRLTRDAIEARKALRSAGLWP